VASGDAENDLEFSIAVGDAVTQKNVLKAV